MYEVTMFESSIEAAVTRRDKDLETAILAAHNELMRRHQGDDSCRLNRYCGAWSKPSNPEERHNLSGSEPDFSEGVVLIWCFDRMTVVEGVARKILDRSVVFVVISDQEGDLDAREFGGLGEALVYFNEMREVFGLTVGDCGHDPGLVTEEWLASYNLMADDGEARVCLRSR